MSSRPLLVAATLALLAIDARAGGGGGGGLIVNSTKDLPDADLLDGVCDADLETPGEQVTLRAAIQHMNATPGADTIFVPPGVFKLTRKGAHEDAGATGDLDVTDDLNIVGAGASVTIIDGKKAKDRVLDVAAGVELTIGGVHIRRGKAPKHERGGGIHALGPLTIHDCIVDHCKADDDGGGIAMEFANIAMQDCWIAANKSNDDSGGCDIMEGEGDFMRCTFSKNKSKKSGGAIESSAGDMTITNCTFSGNKAKEGGAIAVEDGGTRTIRNCTIAGNKATRGSGIFEDTLDVGNDTFFVSNTILANDPATNLDGDGLGTQGGNIDSGETCAFDGINDLSDTDPLLDKLKKPMGAIAPVRALKGGSPALDIGNDATAPVTDQLGNPRVDLPGIGVTTADSGAVELQIG